VVSLPRIRRPSSEDGLKVDFEALRASFGGSYVCARQALVRAEEQAESVRLRKQEADVAKAQRQKEKAQAMRASRTRGKPTLMNVIAAQHERPRLARKPPPPPTPLPPLIANYSDDRELRFQRYDAKRRHIDMQDDLRQTQRLHQAFLAEQEKNSSPLDRTLFSFFGHTS